MWLSEEFFESNYFQNWTACSPLTYITSQLLGIAQSITRFMDQVCAIKMAGYWHCYELGSNSADAMFC